VVLDEPASDGRLEGVAITLQRGHRLGRHHVVVAVDDI